jgi:hypothetical protein
MQVLIHTSAAASDGNSSAMPYAQLWQVFLAPALDLMGSNSCQTDSMPGIPSAKWKLLLWLLWLFTIAVKAVKR